MQTWRTAPPSQWKTYVSPEVTCTPTGTCTPRASEQSSNRSVTLLPLGAVYVYSPNQSCSYRWLPTCTRTTTTIGSFTSPVTMRVSSALDQLVPNKWSNVSETKCSSLVCLLLSPVRDAWLGSSRWHHSTGTQRVSIQSVCKAFLLEALWHRLFIMLFLSEKSHIFTCCAHCRSKLYNHIQHLSRTGRNLHSHVHEAPMTKKHFQVTGYGTVSTFTLLTALSVLHMDITLA